MRRYFKSSFGEAPPRITKDRMKEITQSLDPKDKEEVINGHVRLIAAIAAKFGNYASNNHYSVDVFCEGLLALIEAVETVFNKEYMVTDEEHFVKYISRSVSLKCKTFIQNQRVVNKPNRTIRHQRVNGVNFKKQLSKTILSDFEISQAAKELLIKIPMTYQEGLIDYAKTMPIKEFQELVNKTLESLIAAPKVARIREDYRDTLDENEHRDFDRGNNYVVPVAKEEVSVELLELLERSIYYPIEGAIIKLRAQGYTYQEVGAQVGLSAMSICTHVNNVANRFYKLYKKRP